MRATAFATATAFAFAAGGCASVLPSGARATGEPLRVDVQEHQFSALVTEPVGQVTMTDATGQRVGTATIEENRLVQMREVHWRGVQGRLALSDEDLFRIAGDTEAADLDHAYRRTGRLMRDAGTVLVLGTLAELIAARATGWQGTTADGVAIGCYGGLLAGVMLVVYGHKRLVPDAHPVDRARAEDAVQRYDQTLAAPGASRLSFVPDVVGVSGRF